MKAYFKAVLDCLGVACLLLILGALFWLGTLLTAVCLGVSTGDVKAGLLILAMVAGAVKTAVDRHRAQKAHKMLDTVIELWENSLAKIESEEDTEMYERLKAAYEVTISVLKKERSGRGGRRCGG